MNSKKLLFIGGLIASIALTSCSNFFAGSKFAEELDDSIVYANTPDITITVSCNNSYGTITSNTQVSKKLGTKGIPLSFKEAEAYQFVKWQVYNKDGETQDCTEEDAIYIVNPEKASTKFTIVKEVQGYSIAAECEQRPAVSLSSPQYQTSGVNRDRAIIITFNSDIDKSNFRYTDADAAKLEESGYTLLKDSDELAYGYVRNNTVFYKNIKIRDNLNESLNLLSFFEEPVVSGSKVTITPKKGANNQFQLDSNGYRDIEVVLSNEINNSGIKMLKDYSWNYRVSNITDEQTTVTVSVESEKGTVSPTGTNKNSVGAEIELTYKEKDEYKFIDWEVSESELNSPSGAVTATYYDEENDTYRSVLTILEGGGNISVKPVCAKRPVITTSSPEYVNAGVAFDSEIVIDFNTAVDKKNFYYTKTEFESFGTNAKAVYSDPDNKNSEIIAVDMGGERYFKSISIFDEQNSNIAKHYKKLTLSDDEKTLKLIFDGANLFDFGNNSTKTVQVKLSNTIYANYTDSDDKTYSIFMNDKGEDFNYSFNVNKTSLAKAKVEFVVMDGENSMGGLSYTNTQTFNLGDTFTVNFTPNANYDFIKWSIKGNDENQLAVTEDGTKLVCTVTGAADNIVIKPYCEILNTSQIFFTTLSGSVSPSGYVDYKRKSVIPLVANISNDYTFTRWKVYNTVTKQYFDDDKAALFFKFDDAYSSITNVTVLQDSANLAIEAAVFAKPKVYARTPEGLSSAVNRDTNIRIFTDHRLEESTLFYSNDEAKKLADNGFTILYGANDSSTKPYGYYKKGDDSSYVFKGVKISDNSSGENYLRYFACPYLSGANNNLIIIPIKKNKKQDGTMDEVNNLPGNKEILVQLGTEYGYTDSNVLVGLNTVNNSWLYKTNGNFDTTYPTFKSATLKQGDKTLDKSTANSIPEIKSDMATTDIDFYKNSYFPTTSNNNALLSIDVKVEDQTPNLQILNLIFEKKLDEHYKNCSESYTKNLPLQINNQEGSYTGTVNLRQDFGTEISDGLYKLYFEIIDEAGNICKTNESNYYYILLDETSPVEAESTTSNPLRFFYGNNKITVENLKKLYADPNPDLNYVASKITINNIDKSSSSLKIDNSSTFTGEGLTNGTEVDMKIHLVDLAGHEKDFTYKVNPGVKPGMIFYSDGRFSNSRYSDLTPYGVVIRSDFTNIMVIAAPTYLRTPYAVANLAKEVAGNDNCQVTVGSKTLTLALPSPDDYAKVHNNVDVLDSITNGYIFRQVYKKFDNGDTVWYGSNANHIRQGQYGDNFWLNHVDYSFTNTSGTYTKNYHKEGILYYTNLTGITAQVSDYNDTYTDKYTGRVLFDALTGSSKYKLTVANGFTAGYVYFTDGFLWDNGQQNSNSYFNAKLVGTLTDN